MGLDLQQMPKVKTNDVFLFGPSRFPSQGKIVIPLKYKDTEGNIHYKETEIHLIEHTIGILIGLDTMDEWGSDVKISKSGISLPGPNNKEFIVTGKREGGHIAIQTIPASESDKFYPKQPKPFVPGKTNRNNTRFVKQEYVQIENEDDI